MYLELDLDQELIPHPHHSQLICDIKGTRGGGKVDPKFRSKCKPKYGSGAGSRSGVEPPHHHELRQDIDGTRPRVDPKFRSKSKPKYGSGAGSILKNKAILKIFPAHTKKETKNGQIEMCHNLILNVYN